MNQEKRKGVPGTSGLRYLIAGIVIGVVGVFAVMFVLTYTSCGCEPQPPTTLPLIPTPIPGVTGTAAAQAQSILPAKRLITFRVDEAAGLIGLSYEGQGAGVYFVETRPWSQAGIGEERQQLGSGFDPYTELTFSAAFSSLYMNTTTGAGSNSYDLKTHQMGGIMPSLRQTLYSPDGRWLSFLQVDGILSMNDIPNHSGTMIILKGPGHQVAFSPDSKMFAAISTDKTNTQHTHIEVFRLPDLSPVKTFNFDSVISSPIVFSPDNIHLAFMLDRSLRVISLNDDEQRYFDVATSIQHLAFDPTGHWLAVSGGNVGTNAAKAVSFYPLDATVQMQPARQTVESIQTESDVIGLQFVNEGLLVGETSGYIRLVQWNVDAWVTAKNVMIAAAFQQD